MIGRYIERRVCELKASEFAMVADKFARSDDKTVFSSQRNWQL